MTRHAPISPFCTAQPVSAKDDPTAPNGGSARGYGGRIDHALATSAIKVPGRAGRLPLGILL
jgi:hypothetical protein